MLLVSIILAWRVQRPLCQYIIAANRSQQGAPGCHHIRCLRQLGLWRLFGLLVVHASMGGQDPGHIHLTIKELAPIVVAASIWWQEWKGKTVLALCDNAASGNHKFRLRKKPTSHAVEAMPGISCSHKRLLNSGYPHSRGQ